MNLAGAKDFNPTATFTEAAAFAAVHGLVPLSGSDFHEWEDLAEAGMLFQPPVTDSMDLIRRLREGRFQLYPEIS